MNTRGQSVIEPRHRRRANNDLAPSKMDARSGPLGVTIANVHAAVKHAYDSGGRCLKYRARDRIILEREFKGLGGCSRYVYDAILSPLLNVLAMLKDIGDALENWAFRVKRMHSQRGVLQHIYRDNDLSPGQKYWEIKNIIYNDIGLINDYYTNTFVSFADDLEPTITDLQSLHDLLYAPRRPLILENTAADQETPAASLIQDIQAMDLSYYGTDGANESRPIPLTPRRPITSTTGTDPTTAADRVFTRAYYLTRKAMKRATRIHRRAHRLGDMAGAMQITWEAWADAIKAREGDGDMVVY